MQAFRVLVAERDPAFGEALTIRLGVEPDILVVGVAKSAAAAEHLARMESPDVAVVGATAPLGSSLRVVNSLAALNVRPVLLTFEDAPAEGAEAILAGARAFLSKEAAGADLVGAVRIAARGDVWVEPRLLGGLLRHLAEGGAVPTAAARLDRLTGRERTVLEHLAAGHDYATTARALFLSPSTVRSHSRNLLAKLGARSVLEAVAILSSNDSNVTARAAERSLPGSRTQRPRASSAPRAS